MRIWSIQFQNKSILSHLVSAFSAALNTLSFLNNSSICALFINKTRKVKIHLNKSLEDQFAYAYFGKSWQDRKPLNNSFITLILILTIAKNVRNAKKTLNISNIKTWLKIYKVWEKSVNLLLIKILYNKRTKVNKT